MPRASASGRLIGTLIVCAVFVLLNWLDAAVIAQGQRPPAAPAATAGASGNEINARLITVIERTPLTDAVYRSVLRGLDYLPADVKNSFVDAGIKVIITPTLERLGDRGGTGTEYSPRTHSVIICEQNRDGTTVDLRRLHIVMLHELGHAFDQLTGYQSRGAQFRSVYSREATQVPAEYQPVLEYFLRAETGPRECFASLFACRYYRGDDRRLRELRDSFPRSLQFVEGLRF